MFYIYVYIKLPPKRKHLEGREKRNITCKETKVRTQQRRRQWGNILKVFKRYRNFPPITVYQIKLSF